VEIPNQVEQPLAAYPTPPPPPLPEMERSQVGMPPASTTTTPSPTPLAAMVTNKTVTALRKDIAAFHVLFNGIHCAKNKRNTPCKKHHP
jgi:hypothetical protein